MMTREESREKQVIVPMPAGVTLVWRKKTRSPMQRSPVEWLLLLSQSSDQDVVGSGGGVCCSCGNESRARGTVRHGADVNAGS